MTKAKVGDTIKILEMIDEPLYDGKIGVVEHIDDADQLHGTWGGLAVIEGVDRYTILDYGARHSRWE